MTITPEEFEADHHVDKFPEEYRSWRDSEGVPVVTGLAVHDVNEIETGPWDRTGQQGAFINLYGMQGIDDLHVHDLEPGGETDVQRHYYDEIVWVTRGSGLTVVGEGEARRTFEWEEDSLFYLPKNTPYRHISGAEDEPVRLVSQTQLPLLFSVLEDRGFIFDPPESVNAGALTEDYYSGEGSEGTIYANKYEGDSGAVTWESNFIPDLGAIENLEGWARLGAIKVVFIPFHDCNMKVHIADLPVGMYKNTHRHGPGANVFIRNGEGYSLTWQEGMDEKIRIDWGPRSLFTPPASWYHHHFNLTEEPVAMLAIHAPELDGLRDGGPWDAHDEYNIIDYTEEDPMTRELFEEELAARGLESKMPEECYTDPDYEVKLD